MSGQKCRRTDLFSVNHTPLARCKTKNSVGRFPTRDNRRNNRLYSNYYCVGGNIIAGNILFIGMQSCYSLQTEINTENIKTSKQTIRRHCIQSQIIIYQSPVQCGQTALRFVPEENHGIGWGSRKNKMILSEMYLICCSATVYFPLFRVARILWGSTGTVSERIGYLDSLTFPWHPSKFQ